MTAESLQMISFIVFLNYLPSIFGNKTSFDLNLCKLTHIGIEYTGRLTRTQTNMTCQYWTSAKHKGSELLIDEAFPEESKVLAKNYCRNPNRNPKGPWCYTNQRKLAYDFCAVPLCKSSECRISGTGVEYMGSIEKSSSGKKCATWKESHRLQEKHKEPVFKDKLFPDESIGKAGKKCRNPDGDIAGPWCYVKRSDNNFHMKELCDIPFCDDVALIMYSEGTFSGKYFFFSSINESQFLNISFRLWNPADYLRGEIYLLLSAYDIALDRQDIERWNSGIEIKISHSGSGIISKEADSLTKTPLIVSGAKWTDLEITWQNADNKSLLVQIFNKLKLKRQPIAIGEILIPNSVFEVESFRYYSLGGSAALWNVPSTDEECPVHTISQMNFTRFWLIKKTAPSDKNIEIFVRAKARAVITLRIAPMNATNQVELRIGDKKKIRVYTYKSKDQSRQLAETSWSNVLDFWKWANFKILLLKEKLQLFWFQQGKSHLLIEAIHPSIEKVMWVTFASPWVSYWTVYCDPRGFADPPPSSPPECVTRKSDPFNGSLSITRTGRQCIPWTDKLSIPEKYQSDELFKPYGGKAFCQNFCRNLDNDPKGAYCVVRDAGSESGFKTEYCHPRSCNLGDCKLAGTANDYIGQLNVTRSRRHCQTWAEIKDDVVKVNNFPDPTLEDAGNFCRNPSKSITGCWCFTKDKRVPRDLCFIRDCDKPLECTVLTSGYFKGTFIYILPLWRKNGLQFWLKAWNPDIYEGLVISLISKDYSQEYRLLIGDDDSEKVKLFYVNHTSEVMLLQKTLPHLIPTGKWKGYWLRPSPGKVELGYQGVSTTFFEWSSFNKDITFEPIFFNFGTIKSHWIGVNFQCTECLTIQTSVEEGYKIFPINLWRDETITSNLLVNLRGTGSAFINLMWTQDFKKLFGIQIMSNVTSVVIVQYKENVPKVLAVFSVTSTITEHEWSEYIISFTEDSLTVHKDGAHLLEWKSPFPLLFYWFTITAVGGTIIWTANCPASDIDGEPRDGNWGKWGPWSCSVTCGKGKGKIERICNDPPPNVFGKECTGFPVYEGPCNDFPCGKISPATSNIIRHYLSSQHKSLQVDVSEKVVLSCNSQAISLITKEVSEMNITWTHNGLPYSRTKFHMDENYSLVIHRAQEKHNGVYLCMAYQDPDSIPSKFVLEVISLVVIKPKPKKIRKGKSLTLKCNGLALSYAYADLSQRWELNGSVWKDYGLGSLETISAYGRRLLLSTMSKAFATLFCSSPRIKFTRNISQNHFLISVNMCLYLAAGSNQFTVDKLENVTDSHAGIWTCIVVQEDFKFKWTTNWIYLKVKSAPSFWSHLMEDVATAPLFGKLGNERNAMILFFALIGVMIGLMLLLILLLVKLLKKSIHRKKKK